MKIKKYLANNLPQAMGMVRTELGREAIILNTRRVKMGGIFGLFGRPAVEVTAAVNEAERKSNQSQRASEVLKDLGLDDIVGQGDVKKGQSASENEARSKPQPATPRVNAVIGESEDERKQITEKKQDRAETANKSKDVAGPVPFVPGANSWRGAERALHEELVSCGFEPELASEVIGLACASGQNVDHSIVRRAIDQIVPPPQPTQLQDARTQVIVLIGPSGAGKTTAAAKIAARHKIGNQARVSLITTDTKVAGIHQLKSFGDVLEASTEVCYTPEELQATVSEAVSRSDLVIVDTGGRNYQNPQTIAELRNFVDAVDADEVHLVLPCSMNTDSALDAAQTYGDIGFNRLLFTKADEASNYGVLFNIMRATEQSVSYLSTGQNVPEDLEEATRQGLLALIGGAYQTDQVASRG